MALKTPQAKALAEVIKPLSIVEDDCGITTSQFQIIEPPVKLLYMKTCLAFILLFLFSASAYAQQTFRKNDVYGELLGNGIAVSVNYERQLQQKPGLGVRAGLGYFSGNEVFRLSVPLGVNYLINLKNYRSFFDVGLGATYSPSAGLQTVKQEQAAGGRDYSEHIWSFVPSFGYRHHIHDIIMWRVSATPIFNKYRQMPWIGISVGARFGKKHTVSQR